MEQRVGTNVEPLDRLSADHRPLDWLSEILWPDGQARIESVRPRSSVPDGGGLRRSVGLSWWAAPDVGSAQVLIPATSKAAARTAVRRYHDGMSFTRRLRSLAAEAAMSPTWLTQRVLSRQLVAATSTAQSGLLLGLHAALARSMGIGELHVAVSLGRPKSNRKPVLQLIDETGTCVGWAKVGWNSWTADLVTNESRWLDRRGRAPLDTPDVKHKLVLDGRRVLVTTGFLPRRWPQVRPTSVPDRRLLLAIADLGPRDRVAVDRSLWWATVEEVLPVATRREARAIKHTAANVAGRTVETGAWHGDLTPWNIMTIGRRPGLLGAGKTTHQVIDWEFAADGVPLGFDLCHFHTQVAMEMKGLSAEQALDYSARLSPQGLVRLGVDPHNQTTVFRLYLVELIRRTLSLRAAGMATDGVRQGVAAVKRLGAGLAPSTDFGIDQRSYPTALDSTEVMA